MYFYCHGLKANCELAQIFPCSSPLPQHCKCEMLVKCRGIRRSCIIYSTPCSSRIQGCSFLPACSKLWAVPRRHHIQCRAINPAVYVRRKACDCGFGDWSHRWRELARTRSKVRFTYSCSPRLNKPLTLVEGYHFNGRLLNLGFKVV